jgi:hypothetical protein
MPFIHDHIRIKFEYREKIHRVLIEIYLVLLEKSVLCHFIERKTGPFGEGNGTTNKCNWLWRSEERNVTASSKEAFLNHPDSSNKACAYPSCDDWREYQCPLSISLR